METDRNLLFGALAFQNEYIDLSQFAAVCRAWAADKSRPIAELLVERGWIDAHAQFELERLAERKLKRSGGDLRQTLGQVTDANLRDAIRGVEDTELRQSLAAMPPVAGFVLVETMVKQAEPPGESATAQTLVAATQPGGQPSSAAPSLRSAPTLTLVKSDSTTPDYQTTGATMMMPPAERRSRYTLTRVAGEGGLGRVWMARDLDLNREVALKELRPTQAVHPEACQRFLKEAQITGQLEHPNIVPVYELSRRPQDNQPFYTMRFVRGQTLRHAIEEYHRKLREDQCGALELPRLLQAFVSVCNAIAYAHSRGVIHRDLKPDNVVLGGFGEVIVLDWGLAKLVDRDDDELAAVGLSDAAGANLTMAGRVMGTPAYMAPEQAEGRVDLIDARTDVYGLGAILFEILAGRPPHDGQNTAELLARIISGDTPRVRSVNGSAPAALDAICAKAMHRERRDRYERASLLADDVHRWLADEPVSAVQETPVQRLSRWARRNRTWTRAAAAALCVVAVISVVAASLIHRHHRLAVVARDVAIEAQKMEETQRERAFQSAETARAAQKEAEQLKAVAETREQEVRRNLSALLVANGNILLEQGDAAAALLWYIKALRSAEDDAELARIHRVRVGTILRMLPRPTTMWMHTPEVAKRSVFRQTLSPDRRRVVTAEVRGASHVCDAMTGQPLTPAMPHKAEVTFAAFSPNGGRVATVCLDRTVRVWDSTSGQPVTEPLPQEDQMGFVEFGADGKAEFSGDGRLIAVTGVAAGGQHRRVRVWNVETGQLMFSPLEFSSELATVQFSPDGKWLLTASKAAGTAQVVDAQTGQPAAPAIKEEGLWSACFSRDSQLVATTDSDGTARVWNAATSQPVTAPMSHVGPVTAAVFSPDSRFLATVTSEKNARVWNVETGRAIGIPMRHDDRPISAVFNDDGSRLLTLSLDNSARVWDVKTGRPLSPPIELPEMITDGDFVGNDVILLTASGGSVWDVSRSADPGVVKIADSKDVNRIQFSPDATKLAASHAKGHGRLLDAATGRAIGEPLEHRDEILDLCFSPDGKFVATASKDGTARVWDAVNGRPLSPPLEHGGPVNRVLVSADSKRVVTASDDKSVRVWDSASGQPAGPTLHHDDKVTDLDLSPDHRTIATACGDWSVRLWSAASGSPLTEPLWIQDKSPVRSGVVSVRFSPDGELLLAADQSGYLRLWKSPSGEPASDTFKYGSSVTEAFFTADGRRIVASGYDKFVKVWDASSPSEPVAIVPGGVVSLFARSSPDGRVLFTTSIDGSHLWDLQSGMPLSPRFHPVQYADFSRDSRRLVTVDRLGPSIRIWDMAPDERPCDELESLGQVLAARSIDSHGVVVSIKSVDLQELREQARAKHAADFEARDDRQTDSCRQFVDPDRKSCAKDRHSVDHGRHSISKCCHSYAKCHHSVDKDRNSIAKDRHYIAQDCHYIAQDCHPVAQDRHLARQMTIVIARLP